MLVQQDFGQVLKIEIGGAPADVFQSRRRIGLVHEPCLIRCVVQEDFGGGNFRRGVDPIGVVGMGEADVNTVAE